MALALAMVMVLAMSMTVFASGNDPVEPDPQNPPAATAQAEPGEFTNGEFSQTVETTITATNLTAGDSIGYIQLVAWDTTTSDWKLTTAGESCGVTLAELLNGITEAEATTIASNVSGNGTAMTVNGTTATADVDPGLYFLRAVPAADNKNTVYNPAFVSADYYAGGNSVDLSTAIGSSTVLKKSSVPFDKEVTGSDQFIDVKPGDEIPYKITTTIPSYGTSFVNPTFTITDVLSAGLELGDTITVKYGEEETTETNDDVTITPNGTSGFTVAFSADYLTGLVGEQPEVEITYSATVTTQALENVTYMDNKATLQFSDTPTTTKSKDDITRHYTFSIDANLNGGNHGNERTRELIKIGVDEKGQTITSFTSWVDGEEWTEYTPLAGATFTLTPVSPTTGEVQTYTTKADGYITFNGLDAGTYTLAETAAPAGYVRDTTTHTVVITPTYTTGTDILEGYTVTVDGATSTYTIENMSDTAATVETTVDNSSMTFPIVNTKGTELPSTGGIGTTIFYVIGAILVLGAGILLVTRRRMNAN